MNDNRQSGGIGFLGALQILLIGLKLADVIRWSWWLVLVPLWAQVILLAVLVYITWKYRRP